MIDLLVKSGEESMISHFEIWDTIGIEAINNGRMVRSVSRVYLFFSPLLMSVTLTLPHLPKYMRFEDLLYNRNLYHHGIHLAHGTIWLPAKREGHSKTNYVPHHANCTWLRSTVLVQHLKGTIVLEAWLFVGWRNDLPIAEFPNLFSSPYYQGSVCAM
jgi:hypothetical protein